MTTTAAPPPAATPSAPAPSPAPADRARTGRGADGVSRVLSVVLLAVFVITGWTVLFTVVLSGVEEHHHQHVLYAEARGKLAAAHVPIADIKSGTPIGIITRAPYGLGGLVVVEGADSGTLEKGPGHRPGTPLPGQSGLSVIYGRAAAFGGPFRHAHELRAGDSLEITTGQGASTYVVADVRRGGQQVPASVVGARNRLELVTSDGATTWGLPTPGNTLTVDAVLKGDPLSGPTVTGAAEEPDGALKTDTSGVWQLALWGELLIACFVGAEWLLSGGTTARAQRAWIVLVPLSVAALWGTSDAVFRLLPNLF